MRLIADTHIHLYSCFNINQALDTLRTNLSHLDNQAVCIAFLAERADCNFFSGIQKKTISTSPPTFKTHCMDNALLIQQDKHPDLYLLPGRQIIARENIEILALTVDLDIEDGLPAQEIIDLIRQQDGLPVLSWAPGKWFFKRKKIVNKLLASNKPGTLLLGDTTLRPTCWLRPFLMKKAMAKGFTVICGSDPLPFAGEEKVLGQYGTILDCPFDKQNPAKSIRSFLSQPGLQPPRVGKRGTLFTTLYRLSKNAHSKTNTGTKNQA